MVKVLGIDPRAYADEKLVAPEPLPFVSRSALKRVRDRLPPPTCCEFCGAEVKLVANNHIYGRNYGEWPYAYMCMGCGAYVGVHPQTDLPLGTLADSFTREARKAAKAPFMTLVRSKFKGDRKKAYAWLSQASGIPKELCHFGMMDEQTASKVLKICFDEVLS